MAVCTTPTFGGSTCPQVSLAVTASSSTATEVTLSWTLSYIAHGYAASTSAARTYSAVVAGATVASGSFNINGLTGTKVIASGTKVVARGSSAKSIAFSCSMAFNLTWSGVYGGTKTASSSMSIAAKTSYTISYNANGGTGAPSSQTKWAGTSITLSSAKPTRSNYTFAGWATSSGGAVVYSPGSAYTTDASATLYAVWGTQSYTITYNANGGSGAPSSQTKVHGVSLSISAAVPTKSNYTFKGWGISAYSTTVSYRPGDSYSDNSSITLYAIWEIGYTPPRITNFRIERCTSDGTLSESGTYANVIFYWACDRSVTSIMVGWKLSTESDYNNISVSGNGTSGYVDTIVGGGYLDEEILYNIQAYVSDGSVSTVIKDLPQTRYVMDILYGGLGIAFGKPADRQAFDINWPVWIQGKPLIDYVHPVNSIYISCGTESPEVLFGGTWERVSNSGEFESIGALIWKRVL